MEAAWIAALRGHQVMLMEKGPVLGGALKAMATSSFKQELRHLVDWWQLQMRKLEVDVRLNTEITPETPDSKCPIKYCLAPHGVPI